MDILNLFRHQIDLQMIPAGQALFSQDEPGEFMYVLMSGTADILVGDKVMEAAVPGTIVGEMGLVSTGPRSASVIATSDCKFLPIEHERFNFLVQKKPEFALHVMQVLAERLRRTNAVLD